MPVLADHDLNFLAQTEEQRCAFKDVVEAYPGMLVYEKGTSFNPVRERALHLAKQPRGRCLQKYHLARAEELLREFGLAFPDQFRDCARSLADDIAWLQIRLEE